MTISANDIVRDALEDILVQASEAKIEQSEGNAAIRALNDLMNAWAAEGIELGYTIVSDLADTITIAAGAIRGVKANLALELAPKYNAPITAGLVRKAKEGYNACLDLSVQMAESALPSTLPTGSGNDYPQYTEDTFYPGEQDTILTETGGAIALEEGTEESD